MGRVHQFLSQFNRKKVIGLIFLLIIIITLPLLIFFIQTNQDTRQRASGPSGVAGIKIQDRNGKPFPSAMIRITNAENGQIIFQGLSNQQGEIDGNPPFAPNTQYLVQATQPGSVNLFDPVQITLTQPGSIPPITVDPKYTATYTFAPPQASGRTSVLAQVSNETGPSFSNIAMLIDGQIAWMDGQKRAGKELDPGEHTFQMIANCDYSNIEACPSKRDRILFNTATYTVNSQPTTPIPPTPTPRLLPAPTTLSSSCLIVTHQGTTRPGIDAEIRWNRIADANRYTINISSERYPARDFSINQQATAIIKINSFATIDPGVQYRWTVTPLSIDPLDPTITIRGGDTSTTQSFTCAAPTSTPVPSTFTISGKLFDESGSGTVNYAGSTKITLYAAKSDGRASTQPFRRQTITNGTYSLTNIPRGFYRLTLTMPSGYERLPGSDDSFAILPLNTNLNRDFKIRRLAATPGVPGRLQVSCSGNNVNLTWDASVNAINGQQYEVQYNGYRWTTGNVHYTVPLNSGARVKASVSVRPVGTTSFATGTINCPVTTSTPAPRTFTISGKLFDESGSGTVNYAGSTEIALYRADNNGIVPTRARPLKSQTVTNGRYSLTGIPQGNYRLTLTMPSGYERLPESDDSFAILPLNTNLNRDFKIRRPTPQRPLIEGFNCKSINISNSTGIGVTLKWSASASFTGGSDETYAVTVKDPNNNNATLHTVSLSGNNKEWTYNGVKSGKQYAWQVEAIKNGIRSNPTPTSFLCTAPTATPVPSAFTVNGLVFIDDNQNGRHDNGERIYENAILSLTGVDNNRTKTVSTNSGGQYRFENTPANKYRLKLQIPAGYRKANKTDDSFPFTLNGNKSFNFGIVAPLTTACSVRFAFTPKANNTLEITVSQASPSRSDDLIWHYNSLREYSAESTETANHGGGQAITNGWKWTVKATSGQRKLFRFITRDTGTYSSPGVGYPNQKKIICTNTGSNSTTGYSSFTYPTAPTPTSCIKPKSQGNANNDCQIDNADYNIWATTLNSTSELYADFNNDGIVSVEDFSIWRDYAFKFR